MKTLNQLTLVLCVLALGSTAPALRADDAPEATQKERRPSGKPDHRPPGKPGDMMKERLGLTDAQAEQMQAVHQDTEAKMKALKENQSLSIEEKKAEGLKIREAAKATIATILTSEQKAQFEKMRENMANQHPPGKGDSEKRQRPGKGDGEKRQRPGKGDGENPAPSAE